MQVHADGMRPAFTCQGNVIGDALLVDEVDDDVALDGNAVCAVGVVQEGDFYALDIDNVRDALAAFLPIAVCADVWNSQRVQHLTRAHQAFIASVQTVVVGRQEQVEAHVAQLHGVLVGCAEARITRIRLAAQRAFQIHNGQVGPSDVVNQVLETRAVVVGPVGLLGRRDLRRMLHRIAHKSQVDHVVALQQRHDRQHQYGEQFHCDLEFINLVRKLLAFWRSIWLANSCFASMSLRAVPMNCVTPLEFLPAQ